MAEIDAESAHPGRARSQAPRPGDRPSGIDDAELERQVLAAPKVLAALAARTPDRVVVAGGGRLVNLVVRG